MTVKAIQSVIQIAVKRFMERIPQSKHIIDNTEIIIATTQNKEKVFYSTIAELEAPHKEYLPKTSGEAIVGNKGAAIVLFQFAIKNEDECTRIIWHELGHVLSSVDSKEIHTDAEKRINQGEKSFFAYGASAWTEFIAEAIANFIEDDFKEKYHIYFTQERLNALAKASFANRSVSLYHLGLYLAELLTSPAAQIVLDNGFDIGLNGFSKDFGQAIVNSGEVFYKQLDTNHYFDHMRFWENGGGDLGKFWVISREELERAGKMFYDLSDFVI